MFAYEIDVSSIEHSHVSASNFVTYFTVMIYDGPIIDDSEVADTLYVAYGCGYFVVYNRNPLYGVTKDNEVYSKAIAVGDNMSFDEWTPIAEVAIAQHQAWDSLCKNWTGTISDSVLAK